MHLQDLGQVQKTIVGAFSVEVVSVDGRKMISHGQNMRVGILHVHLLDSAKEKVLLMQYRKAEIQSLMNLDKAKTKIKRPKM